MPKILAFIVVILFIGGIYYYQKGAPIWFSELRSETNNKESESNNNSSETNTENRIETVPINSFEECVAAGNKPLVDAPDKCLTKDGYLFIEGVIEE